MKIEYKIRFEAGGLTITQTTSPETPQELTRQNGPATVLESHELGSSLKAGEGGGLNPRTDKGL